MYAIRSYYVAKRYLPDPADRSFTDFFGREYGAAPDMDQVGVHPPRA